MQPGESMNVLEAVGLEKKFGDIRAVAGVGFAITAGETYGLLGPNGAGKTTSISIISGLLEADSGEVRVMGEPMSPRAVAPKVHLGLVPQDLAIYPDLTARENLKFFGRLYGMNKKELVNRADQVLEVIGLTDRADDRAKEFSGGMKRRLNIGIGLLHRPQLLILDEPTVGVDPQSRNAILEAVEALAGEGMAVLYTTHYMEEAERLCDRVAIIDEGTIKAEGTRRDLVQLVGQKDRVVISGSGPLEAVGGALGQLPGVTEAVAEEQRINLLVEDAAARLPELLTAAAGAGMVISGVQVDEPNLEAAFLHLTGKALRD
ncbi:MAG TPA: ABC transporter ATP-binding protein [Acidimicrobiia bacterium]|nr:ABC transporter ATP-binding protein [Acidimicrobiia bacterium]